MMAFFGVRTLQTRKRRNAYFMQTVSLKVNAYWVKFLLDIFGKFFHEKIFVKWFQYDVDFAAKFIAL